MIRRQLLFILAATMAVFPLVALIVLTPEEGVAGGLLASPTELVQTPPQAAAARRSAPDVLVSDLLRPWPLDHQVARSRTRAEPTPRSDPREIAHAVSDSGAGGTGSVPSMQSSNVLESLGCEARWVDVPVSEVMPFAAAIERAARNADISPRLLAAVVYAESGFDPNAVSEAGACGLTQLMPGAAADHEVTDLFDPDENLRGGAEYLRRQLDRFAAVDLALAAYNAGPEAVVKARGVPPYRQTRAYVSRVLGLFCPDDPASSAGAVLAAGS